MRLNLGCGRDIKPGYVNLDRIPLPGVDVVHNLEDTPLPFRTSTFAEVHCRHVLEHVSNYIPLMEELHRITRSGGIITIEVPHCSYVMAYTDPTHKRFFAYNSMRYFTENYDYSFYTSARFEIVKARFQITGGKARWLNRLCDPMVNLFPDLYERLFTWVFPVENLIYELRVIK